MKPSSAPNADLLNYDVVALAAPNLISGNQRLLEQKPTGQIAHGGGVIFAGGSAGATAITHFLDLLAQPSATAGCTDGGAATGNSAILMPVSSTLRKASIQLAGRLPTSEELTSVANANQSDLAGLDAALNSIMTDTGFYSRVKEMFNDMLLTDYFRFETGRLLVTTLPRQASASTPNIMLKLQYCDTVNWQNYSENTNTPEARDCIQATDGLGREPLEMIAHIVRADRPFSEILTAQYRYLNVYSAKLFGLDLTPYAGHLSDPEFFAEVKVDEMHAPSGLAADYAGIITTNAYLARFPSSSTNRNRGRAYYYLRNFLGQDVMKNAARLDLSSINFAASPWRNNAQCTSCHQTIDPVAGAFQHWTHCYDGGIVTYFVERYCGGPWYPERDMFAPGVAAGAENQLSAGDLTTPLKVLGEYTTGQRAFARAIVEHAFASIMNRQLLSAPTDVNDVNYATLDSAYEAQQSLLDQLTDAFIASQLNFKSLMISIVKSEAFRAQSTDSITPLSLSGEGGGALLPPEILHRKIASVVGSPWVVKGSLSQTRKIMSPPEYLLGESRFRLFGGGINSYNIKTRARSMGGIHAAVGQRLALEMSCATVAYDFSLAANNRTLFPKVERTVIPSGDPQQGSQQPILQNLQYLMDRVWGVDAALDDEELLALYDLLVELQADGAKRITASTVSANLSTDCRAMTNYATGVALPVNQQYSSDPQYVVRAWQGVMAYMLDDAQFLLEQ